MQGQNAICRHSYSACHTSAWICAHKAEHVQVPAAWKILHVQNCSLGQVTQDFNRTCRLCGNSTFSLDPSKPSCDPCPSGATCYGADAFIPPRHYWHSSPNSTTIVACPNADSCEGKRSVLLTCKQVSAHSLAWQLAFVILLVTSMCVASVAH